MNLLNRILTIALGLFLISAGVAKFTTGHVFQLIEFNSGIDLFYPFVNNLTGVAEVLVGVAILCRPTRLFGAIGAAALMIGAIAVHLSPWLGVSISTGLTDGAAAPWEATDFVGTTSSVTFGLAVISAIRAALIIRTELRERSTGTSSRKPARRSGGLVQV